MSAVRGTHSTEECSPLERGRSTYGFAAEESRVRREEVAAALKLSPEQSVGAERVLRLLGLMEPALTGFEPVLPTSPEETVARLARALGRDAPHTPESRGRPHPRTGPSESPNSSDSPGLRPQHPDTPPPHEPLDPAATTLQRLFADVSTRCRREMLVVLPSGARPCHALPEARAMVLHLLDRGVRIRMIYQHAARGDLVTRSLVRDLTDRGAQVRTSAELIDPLLVYDRQGVILADLPPQGSDTRMTEAVTMDDPAMVAFTCGAFENLWNTATPFSPGAKDLPHSFDDLKMSIMQLMAMGHKDELVARRLGISVRTCRRHVAEIMDEIKASSRFQAGVNLTRAGLIDDPFPASRSTPARKKPESSSAQADG